jgi:hypothetical protein
VGEVVVKAGIILIPEIDKVCERPGAETATRRAPPNRWSSADEAQNVMSLFEGGPFILPETPMVLMRIAVRGYLVTLA